MMATNYSGNGCKVSPFNIPLASSLNVCFSLFLSLRMPMREFTFFISPDPTCLSHKLNNGLVIRQNNVEGSGPGGKFLTSNVGTTMSSKVYKQIEKREIRCTCHVELWRSNIFPLPWMAGRGRAGRCMTRDYCLRDMRMFWKAVSSEKLLFCPKI